MRDVFPGGWLVISRSEELDRDTCVPARVFKKLCMNDWASLTL
jgi:hypothetical protein